MGSDQDTAPLTVFLLDDHLDDHEVVRRGVADVLQSDPGIRVVGKAKNAAEALARVPALRPGRRGARRPAARRGRRHRLP